MSISVLILTKNEEQDLPGCLESFRWCDDIHVFDSCSSDGTVDLAKKFGATVTQRPFDNWASHQNWGLRNIPFKNKWVYYSDADERVTEDLVKAMCGAVSSASDEVCAFRIRRRDYLWGKWLRRVTPSPFNIRLFRPDRIKYERLTNPVTVVDGRIEDLDEHFRHFPFSKGLAHWFDKHNSYSSFEAAQILRNRREDINFSMAGAFFEKDKNRRRFYQKELYYRLPGRPIIMFLILFVFRGGFMDGVSGFRYAILRAIYEYMICIKVKESDYLSQAKSKYEVL